MQRVFEPFFQITKEIAGKYGGGLGLTIVSQIVKYLGGNIKFQSKPRKGADLKFYCRCYNKGERGETCLLTARKSIQYSVTGLAAKPGPVAGGDTRYKNSEKNYRVAKKKPQTTEWSCLA